VIDAGSLIVAPGIIDIHSHMDLYVVHDPLVAPKVKQGVTTELLGNCGHGCVPVKAEDREKMDFTTDNILGYYNVDESYFPTYEDYVGELDKGMGLNVAFLAAHNPIRIYAMGIEKRPPTGSELNVMKDLVSQGMGNGAFGFSTGLTYLTAAYSTQEEVIELAKVASEYGGIFAMHQRDYINFTKSMEEFVKVAREADIPAEFSHLMPFGITPEEQLKTFYSSREQGLDVNYDVIMAHDTMIIPDLGADGLNGLFRSHVLPPWVREGGRKMTIERLKDKRNRARLLENFMTGGEGSLPLGEKWSSIISINWVKLDKNKWMLGKTVSELAQETGKSDIDVLCDLLVEEEMDTAEKLDVSPFLAEGAFDLLLKDPLSIWGSDAFLQNKGNWSWLYGHVGWALGNVVRERKVVSLETAIQKMTSLPAQRLGIQDRGLIKEGFKADLVVFDPERIMAVPEDGPVGRRKWRVEGVHHVIVNGERVIENGKHTGRRPGRVIRRR